ncbi:phasin family protein [Natranaerobius thermophilus]|uniref:Polyhydroxyalkanoate synthesis regulator phasin n=1 Tax=Natranaerobius thermophilus (strain ATCC BAA-1301 / DSM 18059 / JW/NM-WN-LF) TaxID=457570 RepID=B2A4X0_NATTJ|nr:ATP synthase subunit B [Natranaerobius thermophilus]ACB83892.1 conserved hypothetical protein [Natranaerobius thermophilus JW/NM-WN-LF]
MKNFLKKGVNFGLGLAVMSKEQIEKMVDELVKKGEIAPEESKRVINNMMERGEEERSKLNDMIQEQTRQVFRELDTATGEDIQELRIKLEELEQRIEKLEQDNGENNLS